MSNKEQLKTTTLASYAVMKALTDRNEYRNSYAILADFIRYIIVNKNLHDFSLTDISNELKVEFGFDNIPLPAIKTSLKNIKECVKNGDEYMLPKGTSFKTDTFQRLKQVSTQRSQNVVQKLKEYATTQYPQGAWLNNLEEAFIKYLLDDAATIEQRYLDIISKFIVLYDDNDDVKEQIAQIREGSILYCGLTYNINQLGSLTSDLTLFLDTEVLFNIVGFNGLLYQKIADDFLCQVKAANSRQKRIRLRYFQEVKQEIKTFFNSAERIIGGQDDFINNTSAMKSILNGCETVGDVRDKESDFFYALETNGILLDDKESYYTQEDYPYNIEIIPEGFPDDERSFEAIRFISHINKRRKGINTSDYTSSKFLLVTETRRIQEISNVIRKNKNECGFALPTSTITNIIWYKLGSCFSKKEYPANTDASIKARSIISREITSSALSLFDETKKQYSEGVIDCDQVAARILLLKEKSRTPDEITAECIDEQMDFSPEYIAKYEEGIKQNKIQLQEKQDIIDRLSAAKTESDNQNAFLSGELLKTNEELDKSRTLLNKQDETIRKQNEELAKYHNDEKFRNDRKEKWQKRGKFILGVLICGVIVFAIVYVLTMILNHVAPNVNNGIKIVIDALGIVVFLFTIIKHVWVKVYDNRKDSDKKDMK